jgi:4-hydroxythreonine-4-phosphate dehydrogenase
VTTEIDSPHAPRDVLPQIAITMGDPAGIGPEVALRAACNAAVLSQCRPIIFGDAQILRRVADKLQLPMPAVVAHEAKQWTTISGQAVVVDLQAMDATQVTPGQVGRATGAASYAYITAAIEAAMNRRVDAVATGPVHKEALAAAGVPYPGHTEIFAARTGASRACMMLTSSALTCSFVTTHVGYRDVPDLLSIDRVRDVIELSALAIERIKQRRPRLVVCGLNPHAGEHGLFGNREEEHIIAPAVALARKQGIDIVGPLPPDTAFLTERRSQTDCFVCMYHDQGHIPLKALAFDVAVNVTLGLPIVRTSVDHGTALDIAWQGTAEVTSMIEAVMLAIKLCGAPLNVPATCERGPAL